MYDLRLTTPNWTCPLSPARRQAMLRQSGGQLQLSAAPGVHFEERTGQTPFDHHVAPCWVSHHEHPLAKLKGRSGECRLAHASTFPDSPCLTDRFLVAHLLPFRGTLVRFLVRSGCRLASRVPHVSPSEQAGNGWPASVLPQGSPRALEALFGRLSRSFLSAFPLDAHCVLTRVVHSFREYQQGPVHHCQVRTLY
jgi:hypothetical protein